MINVSSQQIQPKMSRAKGFPLPTQGPQGRQVLEGSLETMGNGTPLAQTRQVAQARPTYLFDHTLVNLIEEFLEFISQHRAALIGTHLL